jgi:hypothetical protein
MKIKDRPPVRVNNCPFVDDKIISISSGEMWTKFIAVDDGTDRGDYSVEIHGFRNNSGDVIITNEIILEKPEYD